MLARASSRAPVSSRAPATARVAPRLAYDPALDSLRALAVAAVLAFHGAISFLPGGFLGVEVFFVLSGYLITSLLLVEIEDTGGVRLGAFWTRRARRLLPALYVLVAAVVVHQALVGAADAVPGFRGDVLSTLFYVANWHEIVAGSNYFAATGPVSPLRHTWSLAIEEQFYLLWPPVVVAVAALSRRRGTSPRRAVGLVALVGCAASAAAMALVVRSPADVSLAYYGTGTRAHGLLAGAALAAVLSDRSVQRCSGQARRVVAAAGVAGAGVLVGAVVLAHGTSLGLYRFGFLGVDTAAVAVLAALRVLPRSLGARLLSWRPLVGIGKVSYGIYLWHFPLFLWLGPGATGLSGAALFGLRVAASLCAAVLSYVVVEMPVRRWPTRAAAHAALASPPARPAVRAPVGGARRLALPGAALAVSLGLLALPLPALSAGAAGSSLSAAEVLAAGARDPRGGALLDPGDTRPVRVLLVGDSIALTLGLGLIVEQRHYGVVVADDAVLGCAYSRLGWDVGRNAFWAAYAPCRYWPRIFAADVAKVRPDVTLVEMGYWDCADRVVDGRVVHVGEPAYDAYLLGQIELLVRVLGAGGRPVVFLTIPVTDPAPGPGGVPSPMASSARHRLFDALIEQVARRHPGQVVVVHLDRYVSLDGRYAAVLDGRIIRWSDGIHFSYAGGELVAPHLLPLLERLGAAWRARRSATAPPGRGPTSFAVAGAAASTGR
jgi:peptidoglycan/LPS O-acetylase OafA/YrhL